MLESRYTLKYGFVTEDFDYANRLFGLWKAFILCSKGLLIGALSTVDSDQAAPSSAVTQSVLLLVLDAALDLRALCLDATPELRTGQIFLCFLLRGFRSPSLYLRAPHGGLVGLEGV